MSISVGKKSKLAVGLFVVMAVLSLSYLALNSPAFNLAAIVPGLSAAAALNGLRIARKAYKQTKSLRTALKFVGSWSVVSFVIATGGDWLAGMLLNGNLEVLANW